ncbi:MAG: hypothetical protein IFK94_16105, partial [Acidobacteria bacterium]|nr:hypothetical protein [Candidatus Polarisedimenticola svalbardensis]
LDAIGGAVGRPGNDEVLISYRTDLLEAADETGWSRTGWILDSWEQTSSKQSAGYEYLFCNNSRMPCDGSLSLDGPKLGVYDIVDRRLGARLLERGVDLVETFDLPGMLDRIS